MRTKLFLALRISVVIALVLMFRTFILSGVAAPNDTPRNAPETPAAGEPPVRTSGQRIMLALLLDTSNSMDGLIEQAKSQLWKVVNQLAAAKCENGERPSISIALYEYGNSGLREDNGYIRLVSPLTSDLDLISQKLFSLTTNGGDEYCGMVIRTSLNELAWSSSAADLKMIFIAGNEPFDQGPVPYRKACALAKEKDVVVNTIFCGGFGEGVETSWKDGAIFTGGTYMSIDHNTKTEYIATPYDDQIADLNDKLNDTYVHYGNAGAAKKQLQMEQDFNAEHYSKSNKAERAISKSSHVYKNEDWDLVDAVKKDSKAVSNANAAQLPAEMQKMTVAEREVYVKQKAVERMRIQSEIQQLDAKRKEYTAKQAPAAAGDKSLDGVLMKSVKAKAKEKKMDF